jgi:hypothetical protein
MKGRPHFLESFFRFPSNLLRCEGLSAVRFRISGMDCGRPQAAFSAYVPEFAASLTGRD